MGSSNTKIGENMELSVAVSEMLETYSDGLKKDATSVFNSLAKECVQRLKDTSPVGKGKNAGAYAKGWTLKKTSTRQRGGIDTTVVYNKDHYQLTHLLEKGHAMPQGGRAKAQPHIEPVANWANGDIDRRLKEKLQK